MITLFSISFVYLLHRILHTDLTVGLDTRLTSCVAHDGSHESQQELLDADGCSLDTSILPNVQERIINRSGSTIKLLYANFQAFRFPNRDHLHLKCTVVVCKGKCLMVQYLKNNNHFLFFRFMVFRFREFETAWESYRLNLLDYEIYSPRIAMKGISLFPNIPIDFARIFPGKY